MSKITNIKNTYGLTHMPFSKEIPTNKLFVNEQMKETCARLSIALENEDVAMITGDAGSGKSCIIRKFCHDLDENKYKKVYLSGESLKLGDIAKQILQGLNITPPFHASKAIRVLKKTIITMNSQKGVKPVVILDEAQELPVSTLAGLKSFLNYSMDSSNYLFILLCGQQELENTIQLEQLSSLHRRIRIHYSPGGFTLEEISKYFKHQMKMAGVEKQIFTDDAVSKIFDLSKGNISQINRLAFNSLICASAESKEIIEPSVVDIASGV